MRIIVAVVLIGIPLARVIFVWWPRREPPTIWGDPQ